MHKELQAVLERAKQRHELAKTPTSSKGSQDGEISSPTAEELEKAGILKRYQWVTFESLDNRGIPLQSQGSYAAIKEYAETLGENVKQGVGLLMTGSYGTLKTTFAVAVLRHWLELGHSGLMVPMCSLMDNLFTMRAQNIEEWARYENKLRRVSLLVLDDLGGENTDQSWVLSKVDSIVTERYNRMLPIIATTNLSPAELKGTYSGRIIDRLRSTSKFMVFDGKSRRQTA